MAFNKARGVGRESGNEAWRYGKQAFGGAVVLLAQLIS
jgi:hypothetical protein